MFFGVYKWYINNRVSIKKYQQTNNNTTEGGGGTNQTNTMMDFCYVKNKITNVKLDESILEVLYPEYEWTDYTCI